MSTPEPVFEILPWDSRLFGFPVGRLRPEAVKRYCLADALAAMREAGVQLAYAALAWNDQESRRLLDREGAVLVDHKTRFAKILADVPAMPEDVEPLNGEECTPGIEALALASGHKSRYRVDAKVPECIFQELYLTWIRRSVMGELADAVLVVGKPDAPSGMVTVSCKGALGEIGLIAVADEVRGKGVGRRLMAAAEAFAHSRGATVMEVTTQGDNAGACSLYLSCGYRISDEQAFYHAWLELVP